MSHDAATRVVLVRHGQTAWNAATRIQGHTDIALDEHGRWQAERVGAALAQEGLHAVYSSDLLRARDTAQAIAAASGVALALDIGLRERSFGVFEGLTFAEIESRWPEHSRRWRAREPGYGPEGGEALQDFYARCVEAASRLAAAHPGQHIALVAHGGVLDCLYRAAAGVALQAPRSWQLGNASINRVLHAGGQFTLVGWNDAAHLDAYDA
jgi:probable phosphoglycerate mutase